MRFFLTPETPDNPIKIALIKRTPSGTVTNLGTVLDTTGGTIGIGPWEFSLAADLASNIYYVTPPWNSPKGEVAGALYKFGTKAPLVENLSYPAGIATDYAGNVYFGNLTTSPFNVELMEYTTDGDKNDLGSLFKTTGGISFGGWAFDLAVDPDGNVIYNVPNTSTGEKSNGAIRQFAGLSSQTLASGLDYPTGLSVDALGDIYFNDFDYGAGTVELKELPKGGTVQSIGQTYKGGFELGPWAFDVVAYRPPTAAPVFKPAPGTFTSVQSVTLSDPTPGAKIYYNINGVNPPTTSSTLYTGPILVPGSESISAIAVSPGYVRSGVANATYDIDPPAKTPVISPAAGTYANPVTVTITDATAGVVIYYILNGAAPSATSTPYKGRFTVSSSETVKAIAIAKGYTNSAVASSANTVK